MSSIFTTSPQSLLHICSGTFTHISLPDKPFTNALQQQSPLPLPITIKNHVPLSILLSYSTTQPYPPYPLFHTYHSSHKALCMDDGQHLSFTSILRVVPLMHTSSPLRINPQPLRSVAIDYPQPFQSTQIASGLPTHIYHSRDNAITVVIVINEADLPLANPNLFHIASHHYHHGGDNEPNTTLFHFVPIRQ